MDDTLIYESERIASDIFEYLKGKKLISSNELFSNYYVDAIRVYSLYCIDYKLADIYDVPKNIKLMFKRKMMLKNVNACFIVKGDSSNLSQYYKKKYEHLITGINSDDNVSVAYKIVSCDLEEAFDQIKIDDMINFIKSKRTMDGMVNDSLPYIIENDPEKIHSNYLKYIKIRKTIYNIIDNEYIKKCDIYLGKFLQALDLNCTVGQC